MCLKSGLGHLQPLSYAFYIDLGRQIDLVTGGLSGQEGFTSSRPGHQGVNIFVMAYLLYLAKISSARVARSLRSSSSIFFSFLCICGNEKDRKRLAAPGYRPRARRRAFPMPPRPRAPYGSAGTLHEFAAFRVRRHHIDDPLALRLAEDCLGYPEITRHLDNGPHYLLVLHWTPFVKACRPCYTLIGGSTYCMS